MGAHPPSSERRSRVATSATPTGCSASIWNSPDARFVMTMGDGLAGTDEGAPDGAPEAADFAPLWLAEPPARAWERAGRDPNRPLAQDRAAFMARGAARLPAWSRLPMILPFGHSSRELVSALLD